MKATIDSELLNPAIFEATNIDLLKTPVASHAFTSRDLETLPME